MNDEQLFLLVRVGEERYAITATSVREVIRWRAPTPVPGAPPSLLGVISQRGVVLPIVDARLLIGLLANPLERGARCVLLHAEEIEIALLVDEVADLVTLDLTALQPAPAQTEVAQPLVRGTFHYEGEPLALLDLSALITALRGASS